MIRLSVNGYQLSVIVKIATVVLGLGIGLIASGCIPARVPDNLSHTPGPPIVISNNWYQGVIFGARVPDGWRVITSEAASPQAVIFASPENEAVIRLTSGTLNAADVTSSTLRTVIDEIRLTDDRVIISALSAPDDQWNTFSKIYEQVRKSVHASQP
ncbi:MAG: hypothetical protein R3E39_26130 [Anaerolineae bacterium]